MPTHYWYFHLPLLPTKNKFKLLTEFNISVSFLYKKYSINVYKNLGWRNTKDNDF